jgi:hypothetical protein
MKTHPDAINLSGFDANGGEREAVIAAPDRHPEQPSSGGRSLLAFEDRARGERHATRSQAPLSPGGRYLMDEAFSSATSVSSTVNKAVVWMELSAPPAPMAIAVAATETLSGASHRL